MKKLAFSVTNDLVYDQRMIRICTSLQHAGYDVTLIGRTHHKSPQLKEQIFKQHRFTCWFQKGKMFYVEYNIKLFFVLLFSNYDVFGAIDLDSILPNLFASKLRGKKRTYDAHELFCEMQEIKSRPTIYKIWKKIERYAVPQFTLGYTIGDLYAKEFANNYKVHYEVVRNATKLVDEDIIPQEKPTYILYQGAVNEGRSFETLIPAMALVELPLVICGNGNFYEQAKALVAKHNLQAKVKMHGYVPPTELKNYTKGAYIGITLFSNQEKSKSNYLSMANRFFDYMHAGVPQICVAYPEYVAVNNKYKIAELINDLAPEKIAEAINKIINSRSLYETMVHNASECRKEYCWQNEEKKLIAFYKKHIG
jgi:glycosyltransferase involved in cell wall biosynthesis